MTESNRTTARQSTLDLSPEAMQELAAHTTALVTEYFAGISDLPIFPETPGGLTERRLGSTLPLEGESIAELIEDCRAIISGSRHNGHPRFFGYVASPTTPAAAFADLIASSLNVNLTSWRSAPAAAEVERLVVRWLGSLVGYGESANGLLTSGGSMANLIALLIAQRKKAEGDPAREGLRSMRAPMTCYASDQIHMSIPKAADILGLGRNQVRLVESDDRFRMNISSLRRCIENDLRDGCKPFCVVGSAGTVNTGAIDNLNSIAEVAHEYDLWFHIDGAYGALGALDESKRQLFSGIERADSLSLDPHKWLFAPIDCGCLLFRDDQSARAAFAANEADYIKVHEEADDEAFAFWDYGIELSRRFRALKIWFALRYYGTRKIAACIANNNSLAQYLAQRLQEAEDFEVLAPVELSICCFRYVPAEMQAALKSSGDGDRHHLNRELNELNERIMNTVQRGGRAYLSNATINARFALRVCIVNFRATRADIDATIEVVRDAAKGLA